MGGAWGGPSALRGYVSTSTRGFSLFGPLLLLGSVNLHLGSRISGRGGQSFSSRGLTRLSQFCARTVRLHLPLGLSFGADRLTGSSERRRLRDLAPGNWGPTLASGSDGRRREARPGMFSLMANCCSWFKRRQEPVR